MSNAILHLESPVSKCLHCKEILTPSNIQSYGEFCCAGCRFVFNAISKSGLKDFYAYRDKLSEELPEKGTTLKSRYVYLDDPDYQKEILNDLGEGVYSVVFKVQGIHCGACIWLLERIALVLEGVLRSEPSLLNRDLKIRFKPSVTKLSEIAQLISSFGYSSQIMNTDQVKGYYYPLKGEIVRLAIAVFSAMNCMMLAVSLYQGWWSGMEEEYRTYLFYVSALISAPAVFYSAVPFYRRSYHALTSGSFHLDLPISIGILMGYLLSLVSVFTGRGEVYFDSISILIALLLGARFIQELGVLKFKKSVCTDSEVISREANVFVDGVVVAVYSGKVNLDDIVLLEEGDVIPVDGVLTEGNIQVDSSILTGESVPINIYKGAKTFASTKVLSGSAKMICEKRQEDSFFPQTLSLIRSRVESGSLVGEKVDQRSKYFVLFVIFAGLGSFFYFNYYFGLTRGLEVALSVFVISCPCALGLSVPLALSSAFFQASKLGILFSGAKPLENLADAQSFFFDKTGTLTEGGMEVVDCILLDLSTTLEEKQEVLARIRVLEDGIFHPVARAIVGYLGENIVVKGQEFVLLSRELDERGGVVGRFSDGDILTIGSLSLIKEGSDLKNKADRYSAKGLTPVVVLRGERPIVLLTLSSTIRAGSKDLAQYLLEKGRDVFILSGDRRDVVFAVAKDLGILKENCYFEKTSTEKTQITQLVGRGKKVMIGDGLNDSGALSSSDVGISVSGGVQLLQKEGNISITNFTPEKVIAAIEGARSTLRAINLNLALSLSYNLFCTSLAICGYISPLLAAILMPISSLMVISISLFGVKFKGSN